MTPNSKTNVTFAHENRKWYECTQHRHPPNWGGGSQGAGWRVHGVAAPLPPR